MPDTSEFEAAKRAKNAMMAEFEPKLKEHVPYFSWGLTRVDGQWAIAIGCLFLDMRSVSQKRQKAAQDILGTHFEFEGVKYPLQVEFNTVPPLQ